RLLRIVDAPGRGVDVVAPVDRDRVVRADVRLDVAVLRFRRNPREGRVVLVYAGRPGLRLRGRRLHHPVEVLPVVDIHHAEVYADHPRLSGDYLQVLAWPEWIGVGAGDKDTAGVDISDDTIGMELAALIALDD